MGEEMFEITSNLRDQPLPDDPHLQAIAHTASSSQYPSSWMIRLHHFRVPQHDGKGFLAPLDLKGRHRVTVHFQKHPAFDGLTLHPESLLVLAVPTHRIQLKPIASQSSIMKGLLDIGSGGNVAEIGYEMLQLFGVSPMLEIKALQ